MNEIHLIYNPTSGRGNAQKALDQIKIWFDQQQDVKLVVHPTENIGHATSITRDLTSLGQNVTIFALGGDGTVNEVLNGINDFDKTTLGILPYGSGNDFVRAIGLDNPDPVQLVENYVRNHIVKKADYLLLNNKYRAINEIGLGMSAEVISYRDKMKHFSPKMQYKIATVLKSLFWKSFKYTISVDKGQPTAVKSMWFTMNNGIAIGGGMITADDAKIDDGLISVMYVKSFSHIKTLPMLLKCKKGKVGQLKHTCKFTCKEIDIVAPSVDVEFDGNLIDHQTNINIKIVPNKLNLLVTKE